MSKFENFKRWMRKHCLDTDEGPAAAVAVPAGEEKTAVPAEDVPAAAADTAVSAEAPVPAEEVPAAAPAAGEKKERLLSIDRFRGICIFGMVCQFLMPLFASLAPLAPIFNHDADGFQILPGVSFADLFAPMFIFVVGLTMVGSFRSRAEKYGTGRAYWQLAVRFLALIGLGAALDGFEMGWIYVFTTEGGTFELIRDNVRVFAVEFWIAVGLAAIVLILSVCRLKKLAGYAGSVLKYVLAAFGVYLLFMLIVYTAEYIGFGQYDPIPSEGYMFGFKKPIWATLENIGLAGLLALPFVRLGKWERLTVVGVSYAVMTVLMEHGLYPVAKILIEGGLIGGVGWSGVLLLGTFFADIKDDRRYWIFSCVFLLISLFCAVSFGFIAAKRGGTPTYGLFCASIASMIWGGLNYLNNRKPKFDFFAIWGSNAILTYVIVTFVKLLLSFYAETALAEMSAVAALAITLAFLVAFTLYNWGLRSKKLFVRI